MAHISSDFATLAELLFHAEQFCLRVEAAIKQHPVADEDREEVRLKLGQCRNVLAVLQHAYDEDELEIVNPTVRADFRVLIMALLWVTFRARQAIDRRLFRMLVLIESSFTYLLVTERRR